MTIAYLNKEWVELSEARISPLDRGFLFGDGIYEVIPVHHKKPVAISAHICRLQNGLDAIGLTTRNQDADWVELIKQTVARNAEHTSSNYTAIYLHVSRGADTRRHHAFPANISPTIFAYSFDIPPPGALDKQKAIGLSCGLGEDLRWKRCHIKSTSLLGNVLHFQQGQDAGYAETILYNADRQITEASACNVFTVTGNTVVTPPLDNQLLPGITRLVALEALRNHTDMNVEEREMSVDELLAADEVWLTSSTKEIAPVIHVGGHQIADGCVGDAWQRAMQAFNKIKFKM